MNDKLRDDKFGDLKRSKIVGKSSAQEKLKGKGFASYLDMFEVKKITGHSKRRSLVLLQLPKRSGKCLWDILKIKLPEYLIERR